MTEDEYNELLERLVKGAEYLSNPLIKLDDYKKGMKFYLNVVGYKAAIIVIMKRLNRLFYLNVVGYKEGTPRPLRPCS